MFFAGDEFCNTQYGNNNAYCQDNIISWLDWNRLEEFQDIPEGTVVIRSHGVAKEVYDFLKKQDLKIVDATCPFVLKIHRIVEEHAKAGEHIVIIGNDKHKRHLITINFKN